MITKQDLIKEIKRQHKLKIDIGFLGFVENKDLNAEVLNFFVYNINNITYYDWVNGNDNLKELIQEVLK